jgi:4-hydroxythreonine-4-phosphate dehydrogenase
MIVISTGCPASIGPEIALKAAFAVRGVPRVLVGDLGVLRAAAELLGMDAAKLKPWSAGVSSKDGVYVHAAGPTLKARDQRPGKPSERSGEAQLLYVEEAYALAKAHGGALVTAAVSKAAIAHSGLKRASGFLGHTEWLEALDSAPSTTMCFYSPKLSTSLVTTHLPLARVARAISAEGVQRATLHLAHMLLQAGVRKPRIAVASLNPHAGESALLGDEEQRAIVPGLKAAQGALRAKAHIVGPVGAETAYRLALAGQYDGVVAMYHDQATIPMKLLAFGDAVNVTMGLSIVRTSVDHGTAYDIAWRGVADATGMLSALHFGARLAGLQLSALRARRAAGLPRAAR